MYSLFTVYNRNSKGSCVVTGTINDAEQPLFATVSVTQSRKLLTEFKRTNNLGRTRTETVLQHGFETDVDFAQSLTPSASAPVAAHNKQSRVSRFTVEQRFSMLAEVTRMVIHGQQRAQLVVGNGGSGKTYTILDILTEEGFSPILLEIPSDEEEVEEKEAADEKTQYVKVTGAISPMGLYRLLYENRKSIILFDDCDAVFANANSVNILKAVLDTSGDGHVTWSSPAIERAGLPNSFFFEGKILFISNKKYHQIPQPLLSRALILDMDMTQSDIIERARMLAPTLLPRLSQGQREHMINFVEENLTSFRDVSLRMFVLSAPYWEQDKANKEDLMLFTN